MEIKRQAVEKFLGPIAEDQMQIKVSLFVTSSKNQRLKKLNLERLTPEERAAKLHKWGQQHRFVAVVEMGDMVFANVHEKHAKQLRGLEDLTLNGKKVTVRDLTNEEADQLAAVGEAFEEYALQESEKEKKEEKEGSSFNGRSMPREYLSKNRLISDQMHSNHLIGLMAKNRIGTIILNCMQKFNEAQREEKKQKEADDKYFDTKKSEIKKGVLREEIKQGEIKSQEQKQTIIEEDSQRINRLRAE